MLPEKELIQQRKNKLKFFKQPYKYRYKKTHDAAEILKKYKKNQKVSIAGRIMSLRMMGKMSFGHLQDFTGKIQFLVIKDKINDFEKFKKLDIGDIIGINGTVFKTKTKEITVQAKEITLLTKSLRPLPSEWFGLKDAETRYRQRYLDLIVNKKSREVFKKRTEFIKNIRNFLEDNGFVAIETPVLELKTGGAEAKPFITHHNTLDINMYLRISLELHHKRLMVGGYEKLYEIGKVFRNEGMSTEHLQEFTLLEFYWAWNDYNSLMDLVEKMYKDAIKKTFGTLKIKYGKNTLDFSKKFPKYDYVTLVKKKTGIDLLKENIKEKLVKAIKAKKLTKDIDLDAGLGRITDQLYKQYIRPKMIQPCFLINHPVSVSPLSKRMGKNPFLTERFQILMVGSEIGNGFSELNDPMDQKERFEEQEKLRKSGDEEAQMMDEDYIKALEYGMPPTAGFGIGIDRFLMILTNSESIRDVVFFPIMKPEN